MLEVVFLPHASLPEPVAVEEELLSAEAGVGAYFEGGTFTRISALKPK